MSEIIVIIQEHGRRDGVGEARLAAAALVGDLHDALLAAGVAFDERMLVFVDEAEEPLPQDRSHHARHVRHGSRVHVGPMEAIVVAVNFMTRTIERRFPPGARVASVKAWAVAELPMKAADAAEHVLQVRGTAVKPSPDAALHELVHGHGHGHGHRIEFDLVPEKRVEG